MAKDRSGVVFLVRAYIGKRGVILERWSRGSGEASSRRSVSNGAPHQRRTYYGSRTPPSGHAYALGGSP